MFETVVKCCQKDGQLGQHKTWEMDFDSTVEPNIILCQWKRCNNKYKHIYEYTMRDTERGQLMTPSIVLKVDQVSFPHIMSL